MIIAISNYSLKNQNYLVNY